MADISGIGGTRADIASVLSQMRAIRAQTQAELNVSVREVAAPPRSEASFSVLLRSAVDSVAALQNDASAKADAFVRGETNDLVSVMLAQQKSSIAFQALTQVRNKVVSAYQDIMNMPI
ncbi:MAG TPA: flagellar hook-basal body complex protein FliE [Pseudomonadales bacterium]